MRAVVFFLLRIEWLMSDQFFLFGLAGLQLIPIFTLTYLQHELSVISKLFQKIQSKLLSLLGMFISFGLMLTYSLSTEVTIRIICAILLTITLSIGIHYTYDIYTLDEGERNKPMICFRSLRFL